MVLVGNLQLPTLKYRRLRGDIIELYKMVTGKYDTDASINFKFISYLGTQTRGNKYKIFQDHVKYNLRKYVFSNRVIQTWNSPRPPRRESATSKIPGGNSREFLNFWRKILTVHKISKFSYFLL